jgi:hypothetical protein
MFPSIFRITFATVDSQMPSKAYKYLPSSQFETAGSVWNCRLSFLLFSLVHRSSCVEQVVISVNLVPPCIKVLNCKYWNHSVLISKFILWVFIYIILCILIQNFLYLIYYIYFYFATCLGLLWMSPKWAEEDYPGFLKRENQIRSFSKSCV